MKNIKLNVLAGLLLASSAAFGGISGSPHDLSLTTVGQGNANGELCVFCHTPHGASTSMTGAPLWNKFLENTTADVDAAAVTAYSQSFTLYGATAAGASGSTIASATDAQVNNPSLACLSCHDGVSSVDSIVNAPGSGFNSQQGSVQIQNITSAGGFASSYNGIANLTKTLTNTHPISIEFVPGNASLRAKTYNLADAPGNIQAWSGATQIQDILRGSGATADRVECGSCHDPHNGYGNTGVAAGNQDDIYGDADLGADANASRYIQVNFLRHSNKASALCLGCHDK